MKVLLLGRNGQLGSALQELARSSNFPVGWQLIAPTHAEVDFSSPHFIEQVREYAPDIIFNCAAYTQVDLAEKETEKAFAINAEAVKYLAQYSKERSVALVHFSSDYVYEGIGVVPHEESEPPLPKNAYGYSKANGDRFISESGCDHLIFRTSWVYSAFGNNFVKTMLRLAMKQAELRIVEDQIGSPTYANDLAACSLQALMIALEKKVEQKPFPSGVYHLTNEGYTNWAEFARAILPSTRIVGIPSAEYPTPAIRPLNSRLDLKKFKTVFGITPRTWQEALKECLLRLEGTGA